MFECSFTAVREEVPKRKVGLRINFVCNYRITDYVKILTEIDDYAGQMHVAAQLALRDFVGKQKLDDILANKDELSRYVPRSNRAKYCEACAKRVHRRQKNSSDRKRRWNTDK